MLFSVFAITTSAISSIDYNAALLYRELNVIRKEALQNYPNLWPISKDGVREAAEIIDSLGIGRIVELQAAPFRGIYSLSFSDEYGNLYSIGMESIGLISLVDENGNALWYFGSGSMLPAPWWAWLPPWLQCILRVVFFGWIWMR